MHEDQASLCLCVEDVCSCNNQEPGTDLGSAGS